MSLTDPVPPVPQHTPPVEDSGPFKRFTNNWMQWFLQLRDKVNAINESLVTLGLVTDPGLLAKQADGSWASREIQGTTDRVIVSNGDGSDNPVIDIADEGIEDIVNAMLVAGSNITLTYNDAAGTLTIASSGGGGGSGDWSLIKKTTDEARNTTTTLASDSELLIALPIGLNVIRGSIFSYQPSSVMKYAFTFSGTAGVFSYRANSNTDAPSSAGEVEFGTDALPSGSALNANICHITIAIILDVSVAGTLAFTWAQDASSANNVTIKKGSYLEYATF